MEDIGRFIVVGRAVYLRVRYIERGVFKEEAILVLKC
jgi:hypothetical protein